jgi:hypothetical protein
MIFIRFSTSTVEESSTKNIRTHIPLTFYPRTGSRGIRGRGIEVSRIFLPDAHVLLKLPSYEERTKNSVIISIVCRSLTEILSAQVAWVCNTNRNETLFETYVFYISQTYLIVPACLIHCFYQPESGIFFNYRC